MSSLHIDSGAPRKAGGQKVMLATTAYDSPDGGYTFSLQRSRKALEDAGIQSAYLLLSGNCHVDDARNVVIQHFLLSDCSDLVFIDADVSWEPKALVELCGYDCDLVGGVYPYRRPDLGSMPVRMIRGIYEPDKNGLLEVEGLPAGFMRMKRKVPEILSEKARSYWNRSERRSQVPILFERTYVEGTRIGGDINFCLKWRQHGEVYAAYEMRLGHTAKTVVKDSLGAALRRQSDTTLPYIADKIRRGSDDLNLFTEARNYVANPFGAQEDVLALGVLMAREANGPILESGSGLSTILMAAATSQTVWCLEHDAGWAAQVEAMARRAGTLNIAICTYQIKDGWYDITDDLPERFALGLHDGPPRRFGNRMGFFDHMADRCDKIVVDDVDDPAYSRAVEQWAKETGRSLQYVEERAALIGHAGKETLQADRRPAA